MDIAKEIKASFTNGSVITRFIYINIAVFVILRLLNTVLVISGVDTPHGDLILPWVSAPAFVPDLLMKPWTLITYMFTQFSFIHLLVNMLMLYWFGRVFLQLYRSSQLIGVYILGGLFGGLLFVLMYNFIPFYQGKIDSAILLGASGSVMAIIAASAFGAPQKEINLMFIGPVKLIYLGLAAIFINFIGITEPNSGGNIAHLGGILGGYVFVGSLRNNMDITLWIVRLVDGVKGMFKPQKNNMKVKWRRPANEQEYRDERAADQNEIDTILDKIKKSGYESLSAAEKRKLFDAGK